MVFKLKAGSGKEDSSVNEDSQGISSGMEIKAADPSTRVMVKEETCDARIEDKDPKLDQCEGQRYDIGRCANSAKMADDVKYDALKNVWMTKQNLKFPLRSFYGKNHCFQSASLPNFK